MKNEIIITLCYEYNKVVKKEFGIKAFHGTHTAVVTLKDIYFSKHFQHNDIELFLPCVKKNSHNLN